MDRNNFPEDIGSYIDGKTELPLRVLRAAGLVQDGLSETERLNRTIT